VECVDLLAQEVPESFYKLDSNQVAKLYKAQVAHRQDLENRYVVKQKRLRAQKTNPSLSLCLLT
jgi:hypothetical protein